MCLAIHKPKGKTIPEHYLMEGMANNKDGAGFCYFDGYKVVIEKGFFTWKEFIKAYNKIKQYECLIHFRWATHGSICQANCHPFESFDGSAVIHNGILSIKAIGDLTDTQTFVDFILTPILEQGVKPESPAFHYLMEQSINTSKVLIMLKTGKVIIYNERLGHEEKGVWYSNSTYKSYCSITLNNNLTTGWSKKEVNGKIVWTTAKIEEQLLNSNFTNCWNCEEDFMLDPYEKEVDGLEGLCPDCIKYEENIWNVVESTNYQQG